MDLSRHSLSSIVKAASKKLPEINCVDLKFPCNQVYSNCNGLLIFMLYATLKHVTISSKLSVPWPAAPGEA